MASITGPCGDTMEIWVKIDQEIVKSIFFMTNGCGTSIASGSMVTQLAKGLNVSEAQKISSRMFLMHWGDFPKIAATALSWLQTLLRLQ